MDISVVIPLYNEEESLPELAQWIERVMNANGFSYEILFVNDGSTDRSMRVIHELAEKNPAIHAISFHATMASLRLSMSASAAPKAMW